MIVTAVGPNALFYRAFTPQWAHLPESGAGAARVGGRFNRPGIEARYLASTPTTALAEYQAESPLLPPATLVTFLVSAQPVVDFSAGFHPQQWDALWAEAHGNWKAIAFRERREPPSWQIGDLVRGAGYAGILYRSARDATGICLVLFPDQAARTGFIAKAHDPSGQLPKDRSSWRT